MVWTNEKRKLLRQFILEAKHAVVLTGAGISTESGVPDFRSKEGWWNKINPAEVASVTALEKDYELFRDFYKHRIKTLENCHFNVGHKILAEWEAGNIIKAIVTQNIDGFHKESGSRNVYELHGSINDIRCHSCNRSGRMEDFLGDKFCIFCGGKLRPGVVLFGESLPSDAWEGAYNEISKSDLLLVIGTSLNVSPVNSLPLAAGGRRVLINVGETQMYNMFDLVINEGSGKVLTELDLPCQASGQ